MEWVQVVKDLGIPVALLIAIGWGLWSGGVWFGTKVIIPLQERHFLFLSKLEQAINQITEYQIHLSSELERLNKMGCGKGLAVDQLQELGLVNSGKSSKNLKRPQQET